MTSPAFSLASLVSFFQLLEPLKMGTADLLLFPRQFPGVSFPARAEKKAGSKNSFALFQNKNNNMCAI